MISVNTVVALEVGPIGHSDLRFDPGPLLGKRVVDDHFLPEHVVRNHYDLVVARADDGPMEVDRGHVPDVLAHLDAVPDPKVGAGREGCYGQCVRKDGLGGQGHGQSRNAHEREERRPPNAQFPQGNQDPYDPDRINRRQVQQPNDPLVDVGVGSGDERKPVFANEVLDQAGQNPGAGEDEDGALRSFLPAELLADLRNAVQGVVHGHEGH